MYKALRYEYVIPLFHNARILNLTNLIKIRKLLFIYKAHKINCLKTFKGNLLNPPEGLRYLVYTEPNCVTMWMSALYQY